METKKAAQTTTSDEFTVQSPYKETSHQKFEMIFVRSMSLWLLLV
jgi:hypothetical protein